MGNILGIKNIPHIKFSSEVLGSSYVSDKFGGLIGWYSNKDKILRINPDYAHLDSLMVHVKSNNIEWMFENMEDVVIEYYAERKEKLLAWTERQREIAYENELKMKELMPYRKSKVKNAESKIKKRHG